MTNQNNQNKTDEIEDLNQIDCIGVDNRIHICTSWESVTKCGVKVSKKNVSPTDRTKHFCCYECTY